jgi:regulator of sigma E protease
VASILNILSYIGPFLLVLTVVVFIHELGHFLVARWCGVKIAAFSIGFGREIFGFNDRHGTRWRFAWIPLGGYVRFIDDENAASAPSAGGIERLAPEDRAGAFQSKSLGQRAAVVAAGPAFNILSAALIYMGSFWALGTYDAPAVINDVIPGSAAQRAGLKAGDRIVEVNGAEVRWFSDLQKVITQSTGTPLNFIIERAGTSRPVVITPETMENKDPLGNTVKRGAIGIQRGPLEHQSHSFIDSVGLGVRETASLTGLIIAGIPKLPMAIAKVYSGQQQSDIGGPIAIAEMTKHASSSGLGAFLGWIAGFSIMLGIMNLLPIPVLDGGHLMFYALEAIRGKPLDERKQELSFKIGLAILGTMMFAALFGDIMRKLGIG